MRPLDPLRRPGAAAKKLGTIVTRMALNAASGVLWQLVDGSGATRADVPSFQGIGFVGFPADDSETAEAIRVLEAGKPSSPIGIAARDEAMREANSEIAAATGGTNGAAAIFNGISHVWVDGNGDVFVKPGTGRKVYLTDEAAGANAVALATKKDVDDLATWADNHIHPDPSSGNTGPPTTSPPSATGTSVTRGK